MLQGPHRRNGPQDRQAVRRQSGRRQDRRRLDPDRASPPPIQFDLLGQALSDLSGGQVGQVCATGSTDHQSLWRAVSGGGICTAPEQCPGPAARRWNTSAWCICWPNPISPRSAAKPRNSWPAANSPCRPAATAGQRHGRVQAVRRRPVLHAGGAVAPAASACRFPPKSANSPTPAPSPCRAPMAHGSGGDHSGPDCAPRRNHGRASLRRQLRHRRPDAAQHQAGDRRLPRREGPAGAGRPVPQPRLPE